MAESDLVALNRAIAELRECVGGLRARYGDSAEVRRLVNDVERLDIDAADLAGRPTPPKPRGPSGGKPEVVVVPDTPYDPALWLGADDEGVGGVRHHH